MEIYNAAVGQVVTLLRVKDFAPATAGPWKIAVTHPGKTARDPRQADGLIPAASVRITGLIKRSIQTGIGVPYVFSYSKTSPFLAGQPGVPRGGISTPTTAVLTFAGSTARLTFQDTLRSDQFRINSQRVLSAADFSAPVALMVSRSENRSIDTRSFLFTRQRIDQAGLFQFQPYDPNKIPVLFVHGLLSRPEA